MAIRFNVRDYASNATTPDVYIQRNFNQINLMVYLFEGMTFKSIFEAKMTDLVPLVILRVQDARGDLLIRKLEWTWIDEAAKTILDILSAGHELAGKTLKDFFVEDYSEHTEVFALFQKIEEAGIDLPFLHQTADQKALARELFDSAGFLNDDTHSTQPGIGNLTEYELYTKKYIDYFANLVKRNVCNVIKMGKEAGVLRGQVPGGSVKATTASKVNDMACKDNVCVTYVGLYCVMTGAPPVCALESDPYPDA